MRVTESRLMTLASEAMSKQTQKVADAQDVATSGLRVSRPSTDAVAWAEGMRAEARVIQSHKRGLAIARATERLGETDRALEVVGNVLARVRELGLQAANGTYGAEQRLDMAREVRALRDAALAAANTRGADGEYILAGNASAAAPFDASGTFVGDSVLRQIETSESSKQIVTVSGTVLTAANGVDIFAVIDALATAMEASDIPLIQASIDDIAAGVDQVANARSEGGARMAALDLVDDVRRDFELSLAKTHQRAVQADPIAAALDLARNRNALESSRRVAEEIVALARPR